MVQERYLEDKERTSLRKFLKEIAEDLSKEYEEHLIVGRNQENIERDSYQYIAEENDRKFLGVFPYTSEKIIFQIYERIRKVNNVRYEMDYILKDELARETIENNLERFKELNKSVVFVPLKSF